MSRALPIHPRTGLAALAVVGGRPVWPIAGGDGRGGNPVLTRLIAQRAQQQEFIDGLLRSVEDEGRDLVDAEVANLNSARERMVQLDAQIAPLEAFERTAAEHSWSVPEAPQRQTGDEQRGAGGQRGGGQERQRLGGAQAREQKYESVGHFMVDYIRAVGFRGAQLEPNADAAQRVSAALGRTLVQDRAAGQVAAGVHQTTADTPGLLPVPIIGTILNDLDGARPFVASVGIKPLNGIPGKTWNRPYISQHTQVAEQAAEKAELVSRELKIDSIPFTKKTFGGWLNISRQEIDWTDPAAWNAIVADLQTEYGLSTEDWAALQFAGGVTQTETVALADRDKVTAWVRALYKAAVKGATGNGTKRANSLRLPDHIWTSMDMWADLGTMLTNQALQVPNTVSGASTARPGAFSGDILDVPRTMVPGLTAGTVIVGRSNMFEYYEERIGLLQAIEPKVLGVEVAYGGYGAAGFLDATAFTKITVATA